jgi:hypothetical protein
MVVSQISVMHSHDLTMAALQSNDDDWVGFRDARCMSH